MAEKLGLGNEVRQLKIGQSFTNPKSSAFHSIKYDFKPASVDTNKIATVDVGSNHQVTVTVPHLDGAGVPQTVFKGSQRPYQKECVLIIDRVTGEITLEKLACNIQVKKTRSESAKMPLPQERLGQGTTDRSGTTSTTSTQSASASASLSSTSTSSTTNNINNSNNNSSNSNINNNSSSTSTSNLTARSQTPPIGQRISHKTKVTSGSRRPDRQITHLVPKHSPLHASPNYPSPGHANRSPRHNEPHGQSALASLPMIGIDDFSDAPPSIITPSNQNATSSSLSNNISNNNNNNNNNMLSAIDKSPIFRLSDTENGIGTITDTSSSSSDSDSDSDPDNTVIERSLPTTTTTNSHQQMNGHSTTTTSATTNGLQNNSKIPAHLLNEDLCLSESGSDSD